MSTVVAEYLENAFNGRCSVDADVLLTAMFYVEKSRGFPATGASEALHEALAKEVFSDVRLAELKQNLLRFVIDGCDPGLLVSAITVLRRFGDPTLQPLFITWLDTHLRKLLQANMVVSQLLFALDEVDETFPRRQSASAMDVDANIETARAYLGAKLGVKYPW